MERGRFRILRSALLLSTVLGLTVVTFMVLDLLGLTGWERFVGYVVLTTGFAGAMIFYTAMVVTRRQQEGLGGEGSG